MLWSMSLKKNGHTAPEMGTAAAAVDENPALPEFPSGPTKLTLAAMIAPAENPCASAPRHQSLST